LLGAGSVYKWTVAIISANLRFGEGEVANRLVQIDIATGVTKPVAAGPGVKLFPAVLASGEVAYFRRDGATRGVFYASGKAGPSGADVRSPSWSADGARVVYSRYEMKFSPECEALEPESKLRTLCHGSIARIRSHWGTSRSDEKARQNDPPVDHG
jgi:hypothetical protein